ncbi:MAG: hypothetical protein ACRELX_16140 [Longimicrobiales bacterium]
MTAETEASGADTARAWGQIRELREVLEPYRDYDYAVSHGYRPFMERMAQQELHATNYRYARLAARTFDPARPTSLLYEKHGEHYELVGVMYTAPGDASLDELDGRVPLSLAQWHLHVDLCLPPRGDRPPLSELVGPAARFGPQGSIATREECDRADGRFLPRLFGWMVHVYPFEETLAVIYQPPAGHRDGHADGAMLDGAHTGH